MKIFLFILILTITSINFAYSQTVYNIKDFNGKTIDVSTSETPCSGIFTSSDSCINSTCNVNCGCAGEDYTITFYSGSPNERLNFWFAGTLYYCDGKSQIYSGDHLYIYDGADTSSTLMHDIRFTNYSQYSIISSGSYITFHWKSTTSVSYWWATVNCEAIPNPPLGCNGNAPASNFCADAPVICNLNGYCGNTSNYYTVDIPDNYCESCSLFRGTLQNNSWLKFTADTTSASFDVSVSNCSQNMGIQFGVYSGTDCTSFQILSDPGYTSGSGGYHNVDSTLRINVPFSSEVPSLVKGQNYYIMVDGLGGDVCDYSIKAISGVLFVNAGPDQTICKGQQAQMNAKGGDTYVWTPSSDLSSTTISNPIATPTETTTYTVSFTGGNPNCPQSTSDDVVVTVVPLPKLHISVDDSILCNGNSTHLAATGANSYLWSPSSGLSNINISNPTAQPSVTTSYTLTGTIIQDNIFCSNISKIKITVNPLPEITAAPKSICKGNSADVSATASGSPGPFTYKWNTGQTTSSFSVNPIITTTYTVTVTDNKTNCQSIANVPVTVNSSVIVSILPLNPSVCKGDNLTLNASGAQTYKWSSSATGASINITPQTTTIYSVTGTDASGCIGNTTITVTVYPIPNAVVTPESSPSFCPGGSVILDATEGLFYFYQWKNNGINISGSVSSNFTANAAGNYSVVITGPGNCSNTSNTIQVTVSKPDAQITPQGPLSICKGNSAILNANSGIGLSYQWLSSNTNISGATNNTLKVDSTGYYTVVVSSSINCSSTSNTVQITAKPLPPAKANAEGSTILCKGGTVNLNSNTGNGYSYQWINQSEIISGATNSEYTANSAGNYTVVVTSESCSKTSAPVSIDLSKLSAKIQSSKDTLCAGQTASAQASAQNGMFPYSYQWIPPDSVKPTFTFTNTNNTNAITGTQLFVRVTDKIGCTSKDSVIVFEMPDLNKIIIVKPDTGFTPLTVNFTYSGGSGNITWNFGDNTKDTKANTTHTYIYDPAKDKTGTGQTVYHARINIGKCIDSIDIIVKIPFIKIIPNVFTPNNDGKNDYFTVEGNGLESIEVKIYDRWGLKVCSKTLNTSNFTYDNSSASSGSDYKNYILWDGTNKNRGKASAGVYFYILNPTGKDGKGIQPKSGKLSGSVTIIN